MSTPFLKCLVAASVLVLACTSAGLRESGQGEGGNSGSASGGSAGSAGEASGGSNAQGGEGGGISAGGSAGQAVGAGGATGGAVSAGRGGNSSAGGSGGASTGGSGGRNATGGSVGSGGLATGMGGNTGGITDIDGNVYTSVKIGTQTWMVENLKTTKLNDGTPIPLVTVNAAWATLTTPGYSFPNNNAANKNSYGPLYNWFAVSSGKLAPAGWHVATYAEWNALAAFLGGVPVAGGKLKESGFVHWQAPNTGATNETGFSAMAGGYRDGNGGFLDLYAAGGWWTSTAVNATSSWFFFMDHINAYENSGTDPPRFGFSVRCIHD